MRRQFLDNVLLDEFNEQVGSELVLDQLVARQLEAALFLLFTAFLLALLLFLLLDTAEQFHVLELDLDHLVDLCVVSFLELRLNFDLGESTIILLLVVLRLVTRSPRVIVLLVEVFELDDGLRRADLDYDRLAVVIVRLLLLFAFALGSALLAIFLSLLLLARSFFLGSVFSSLILG